MKKSFVEFVSDHRFQCVIFDMDGTLIDSEEQTLQAIKQILGKYGIKDASLPFAETSGRSWKTIVQSCHECYPSSQKIPNLSNQLKEAWNNLLKGQVRLIPGALEAVAFTKKYFSSIGVVSSSPRSHIESILHEVDLLRFFEDVSIIGGDQVKENKPKPEGYLRWAFQNNVHPSKCLVFEDSIAGIHSAKSAGMSCIGILCASQEREECEKFSDVCIENYMNIDEVQWAMFAEKEEFK